MNTEITHYVVVYYRVYLNNFTNCFLNILYLYPKFQPSAMVIRLECLLFCTLSADAKNCTGRAACSLVHCSIAVSVAT